MNFSVDTLRKWIGTSNQQNGKIWLELKRIHDIQTEIVEILNPNIIKAFYIKQMDLKVRIQLVKHVVEGLPVYKVL